MILLDTNVVSELMRRDPAPAVIAWFSALDAEPIAISAVTITEIEYGLARLPAGKRRNDLIARFETLIADDDGFPVFALDEEAAARAGQIRARREAMGASAPLADMLIAGTALIAGAKLATRNVRDFEGIGLDLINPWHAA